MDNMGTSNDAAYYEGGAGLRAMARVERPVHTVAARRPRQWFPARTLHLVDIENLAGAALPSRDQVTEVQGLYVARLAFGADDQVVMAASHLAFLNAALGWPSARYRVRSGPNGADLELLDVLQHEDVAGRFTHVVIGSGDGMFSQAAANLAARDVWVTVVSRRDSLSRALARAATDVIHLDAERAAAA
jgi:NYN domain